MKKLINTAIAYAVAAMAAGVFYREFTKWNNFSGVTMLGKVHAHLFLLGMIVFLFAAIFSERLHIEENKLFITFYKVYNIGVPLTAVMMIVRGIVQVLAIQISAGVDAAISGIAGIGHILTGVGLIFLLVYIKMSINGEK
jgi:hypothetical protein